MVLINRGKKELQKSEINTNALATKAQKAKGNKSWENILDNKVFRV